MTNIPTNEDVIKIIADEIAVEPSALQPHTKLSELGVDSLTVMEVLFVIEERFSMQMELSEATQFTTFGELLDDLHRQIGLTAPSPAAV